MSKEAYFTYNQLKCIELMALGDRTQVSISEEVGINPLTLTRWKKDPKFMHAIVMRSRQLLKQHLPKVYNKLAEQAEDGRHQHIKILLEHLENLEKAYSNETTISFTWKESKKDEG